VNEEAFKEKYQNITKWKKDAKTTETRPRQFILEVGEKTVETRDVRQEDFNIDREHEHGNRQWIDVSLRIPFSWIRVNFDQLPTLQRPFGSFPRDQKWYRLRRMVDDAIGQAVAEWKYGTNADFEIEFSGVEGGGIKDIGAKWGGLKIPRSDFEFNSDYDIIWFDLFVRLQRE